MAMDYHERKFASRNKPRRNSIWGYVVAVTGVLLLVYAAGAATGWFVCSYRMKAVPAAPPSAGQTGQQAAATAPPADAKPVPGQTPLTFYETLPQGSKTVIGSGINPKLPPQQASEPAKPVPAPLPQSQPTAAPSPAKAAPAAASADKPAPAVAKVGERRFTVQVASVKEKSEAETIRARLAAKGLNPSIIAVNVAGKGLLYRVRAGRHLLQSEAQDIAGKLGSGAIVIPE